MVQNKVEDKFREEDALQKSYIEEFIIQVGDSDEEDSNSDSDIQWNLYIAVTPRKQPSGCYIQVACL